LRGDSRRVESERGRREKRETASVGDARQRSRIHLTVVIRLSFCSLSSLCAIPFIHLNCLSLLLTSFNFSSYFKATLINLLFIFFLFLLYFKFRSIVFSHVDFDRCRVESLSKKYCSSVKSTGSDVFL
jgi:hypothetical protein